MKSFSLPEGIKKKRMIRNVFACLVHENPECVVDLVQNLRFLDPSSTVLLYDGGLTGHLLDGVFSYERDGTLIHPAPRPMKWGQLHVFAIDCMRFALQQGPFDTLTVVDSDQLAIRPGYSPRLAGFLAGKRRVGMLSNTPGHQGADTEFLTARAAHAEFELWRPFLRRFPHGESRFVHWSFWPATVFTASAARDIVRLFDVDAQLKELMNTTQIWATEEVILPTLVALLGYRILANPCSFDYVRYRMPYTVEQIDAAMHQEDVYWAHPIPRWYDNALRQHIRSRFHNYGQPGTVRRVAAVPLTMVLTLPILERMRSIEGWLEDHEADLLIGAATRALTEVSGARAIVEVGSYCGRATVVLASVVEALQSTARVWSIDPHDGKLGTADDWTMVAPSHKKLKANLAATRLTGVVKIVRAIASRVRWSEPIALLLIDGLHDRASVESDFGHFDPWVVHGGYVAFHDYASYFPDVVAFVDDLLAQGIYQRITLAGSLIVLRKLRGKRG